VGTWSGFILLRKWSVYFILTSETTDLFKFRLKYFFNQTIIDLPVVFIRPVGHYFQVILESANDKKKACNSLSFKKDGKFIAI